MVVIAVIAAISILWFFLHGGVLWHRETAKPVERSASGPAPTFVGAPDLQEVAARQSFRSAAATSPPPVDESAEFNAPLMIQQQRLPAPMEPRTLGPAPDTAAMAGLTQGGSSLFTATAVAYRVVHPTYTIRKGTVLPCTDVTACAAERNRKDGVDGLIRLKALLQPCHEFIDIGGVHSCNDWPMVGIGVTDCQIAPKLGKVRCTRRPKAPARPSCGRLRRLGGIGGIPNLSRAAWIGAVGLPCPSVSRT